MFSPKTIMSPAGGAGERKTLDKSYTSASARAVAASSARRRSSNVFATNVTPRRSISSARSTPNRALQISQLAEAGGNYTLESFGTCLPALVMEALAFAEKNSAFSAALSPSGWAWLVAGRRLLLWRYRTETSWKASNHQFRELTLPPSDLAHRAQLINVFSHAEGQIPSCIAVSPEGFVRYWPTITHEGSYQEMSTDLQGQECDNITYLGANLGCLLSTTTSTLVLIQPGAGVTGSNITMRQLKVPAGILGGISRKVTSLVFGSMPTPVPEARLVSALIVGNTDLQERQVVILSARCLQKWNLSPEEPDRLLYECNIDKFVYDAFIDHVWGRERVDGRQLQIWLVAGEPTNNGKNIMILAAAVNSLVSQQLVYAFVTFDVSGNTAPTSIAGFSLLKLSEYYQESAESMMLSQRFLVCGNTAYIYTKNTVLCVSTTNSNENDLVDRIEFSHAGDSILGAGKCNQTPIFFSSNNGVVSINPSSNPLNQSSMVMSDSILDDTIDVTTNLSCFNADEESIVNDVSLKLQTAFLYFNKKNITQANIILEELFPGSDSDGLNTSVANLSLKLIDDMPANDPRWAEVNESLTVASRSSSTKSLLITNQLNDKIKAHQIFILFLQKTNLWQKLGISVIEERSIQTRILLAEHSEQLTFAIELLKKHSEHKDLINEAIKEVISDRSIQPSGRLTNSDIFYKDVSKIEDVVWGLIRAQEEVLSADISPRDASLTIFNVNSILLDLLKAAREAKYAPGRGTRALMTESKIEYIPWVSSIGPKGVRTLLSSQHNTTVEIGLTRSEDGSLRGKLYSQIVDLTDEILSGYQPHLSSLAPINQARHQTLLEEYQKERYSKIQPLVKGHQYDQATNLAEKFCDFRTLIEICDQTDNQARMSQYMNQFKAQGFSDFVFRWYLETGKRGKLLSHGSDGNNKDLTKFLQEYSSLAWLHQINSRDFSSASKTLKDLALDEKSYLSRKKTLLSLAKLSGLASCTNPDTFVDDTIAAEEDLVSLQEDLPKTVLDAHCIDAENMRVFTPIELIHMYSNLENTYANEYDFKKALELLNFVDDPADINEMKEVIWSKAILKDNWDDLNTQDPINSIKNTIFYKTIEMAQSQGCYLPSLLLPVEAIFELPDLEIYNDNVNFKFLIKAAYEALMDTYDISVIE